MTDHEKDDIKRIHLLFEKSISSGCIKNGKIRSIEKIAGDASPRKYFRLKVNSESYVVCLDQPFSEKNYPFIEIQKFLSQLNVPVPRLYDVNSSEGYLLEEDLGNTTLLQHSFQFRQKDELDTYKKCIDLLVKFQSHRVEPGSYSFQKLSFNEEKLNNEVEFSIQHFFKFLLNDSLSNWENEINAIKNDLSKINKVVSQKSMVFSHRDFHSRNIMIRDNDLVVIDFQDALMGIPQYDLVSLLDDCYYELDPSNKENIKKYYFSLLSKITNDQKSYSDFSYFYDLICIQRTFKVLGTFSFLSQDNPSKNGHRYLKYIAFAFEKLKKVIWKYDDLHSLRKNLSMIYYED